MDSKRTDLIKDALVIVPAAHISLCFVYLYFYYRSFGNSLQAFASPTDVFSVSLAEIAPTYLGLAAGAAIALAPLAVGRQPMQSSVELKEPTTAVRVLVWLAVGNLALWLLAFFLYHWLTDYYQYFFLFSIPVAMQAIYTFLPDLTQRAWTRMHFTVFMIVAILSLISINGLSNGQRDRMISYSDASKDHPRCGEYVILAPLASRFLAIAKDQSRVLISEDCSAKVLLVPAQAFRPPPPPLAQVVAERVWR